MLFTFEEFAEIPNKMHAFYARAFDTLFQKHDADKDQFVRRTKTNLSREDFKLVLSSFCAISYLDGKFEFKKPQITDYINKGIQYSNNVNLDISVSANRFLSDLKDSICLIQKDGLNYVFVHRSFQEYFSAVFLEKLHASKVKSVADRFCHRFSDNVISMALDMSRETMEQEWLIPTLDFVIDNFTPDKNKSSVGKIFSSIFPNIHMFKTPHPLQGHSNEEHIRFSFPTINNALLGLVEAVCQQCASLGPVFFIKPLFVVETGQILSLILKPENAGNTNFSTFAEILESTEPNCSQYIELGEGDSWWLEELGMREHLIEMVTKLAEMREECLQRVSSRENFLSALLS